MIVCRKYFSIMRHQINGDNTGTKFVILATKQSIELPPSFLDTQMTLELSIKNFHSLTNDFHV